MALTLKLVNGSLEYCDENGKPCSINAEMIGDASPEYPMAKLFEEFYETTVGEAFLHDFGLDTSNPPTGETNSQAVERTFRQLYAHDPRPTLSRIIDTVRTAIDAGELTPIPKTAMVTRRRGKDGCFLTEHDRLRQLVRDLLNDPNVSAQSIRERADKDAAFGGAFRDELSVAPPVSVEVEPDEELEAFADAYVKAPSIKPIAGFVTLDGKKWPAADFNARVEEAIEAGLLR